MTDLNLRSATPQDTSIIGAMHRRSAVAGYAHVFPASSPPPSEEDFVRRWQSPVSDDSAWAVVVAEHDGQIVGVVMFGPDPDEPRIGDVARLYVDPDRGNDGIGRALLGDQRIALRE